MLNFPLYYNLADGTHVMVNQQEPTDYEFHLTRLNSEKHNFTWHADRDAADSAYDTRFDEFEKEAIELFKQQMKMAAV